MPLLPSRVMILRAGAAFAALFMAGSLAIAQDDDVVATVNGHQITEAELQVAMADLGQQFAQLPAEQRRAAVLTAIIEIRLVSAQAEELGLGDSEEFRQRMEFLRNRALHSAYIESEISTRVTDEVLRERYESEIADIEMGEEIRARHIIVETQEEAAGIIAQLDEGGDFEELAQEHSQDGAAAQGGDLGYFTQGQMVPEFEEAAFAMEVSAHSSEPVETQFGWHVIKLEDRRDQSPPEFDEVSNELRQIMLSEVYMEQVEGLREAAEIEIADPQLQPAIEGDDAPEAPAASEEPVE